MYSITYLECQDPRRLAYHAKQYHIKRNRLNYSTSNITRLIAVLNSCGGHSTDSKIPN